MLTHATGEVDLDVPRDRDGTFEPVIVKKRQRRLTEVDEIVLSLYARGLTTGEISAHFAQIYWASVSKETVSRITDKVIEEMTTWQTRPLNEGLRRDLHRRDHGQGPDGQVANRPIYAAIGGVPIIRLWNSAWEEFIPFLDYDLEIRTVLCPTNAIESLNARYRRAVRQGDTSRPSSPP